VFDEDDLHARTDELAAFVTAAGDEHGIPAGTWWAVGFSNGANIASALLFQRPEQSRAEVGSSWRSVRVTECSPRTACSAGTRASPSHPERVSPGEATRSTTNPSGSRQDRLGVSAAVVGTGGVQVDPEGGDDVLLSPAHRLRRHAERGRGGEPGALAALRKPLPREERQDRGRSARGIAVVEVVGVILSTEVGPGVTELPGPTRGSVGPGLSRVS